MHNDGSHTLAPEACGQTTQTKKGEIMPKVKYTRGKGLYQTSGQGLDLTGDALHTKRPVVTLADAAAAQAIRSAITVAESGTVFTVPALSSGTQTITLPALSAATIGCTYTFVMIATAGQIFSVLGADSDKILAVKPDGAGNNTAISQAYELIGFKAAAVLGSAFTVTCITSTAATGWQATDVIDGLANNVGSINLA